MTRAQGPRYYSTALDLDSEQLLASIRILPVSLRRGGGLDFCMQGDKAVGKQLDLGNIAVHALVVCSHQRAFSSFITFVTFPSFQASIISTFTSSKPSPFRPASCIYKQTLQHAVKQRNIGIYPVTRPKYWQINIENILVNSKLVIKLNRGGNDNKKSNIAEIMDTGTTPMLGLAS